MSVVPLETPRRLSDDRGSALVEAAFISPVFFYLILSFIELGLLSRSFLTVSAATQDGARTASILGYQADADYQIIQAVKKSTAVLPTSEIIRLVVFKATAGSASVVPAACDSSLVRYQNTTFFCNTYVPAQDWNQPQSSSAFYNCTVPGWSAGYCPSNTTRKTAQTGPNGPPDYIGITIDLNHAYVTKLFGTSKSLTSTTITQLEPGSVL